MNLATLDELKDALVENSDLDRDQVEAQMEAIQKEYEGLVGEEASAYLTGKRVNVDLNDIFGEDEDFGLDINNLMEEMYSIDLDAEVEKISDVNHFDGGKVRNITIKDDSGKTQISLWNEDVDAADKLEEGDKVEITGAYTRESDYVSDRYGVPVEVRLGKKSKMVKAGEEEVVIYEGEEVNNG